MANKKFCIFGPSYKGERSRSIHLIYDAAKRLRLDVYVLPKRKLLGYIDENGEFKFKSLDPKIVLEDINIFYFRMVTGIIDGKTKARYRIFPEMITFAKYLHFNLGKKVYDSFLLRPDPNFTKITNMYLLSQNGIPNIQTWFFLNKKQVIKNLHLIRFPIITKPVNGTQGRGVKRFDTKEEFVSYLNNEESVIFYPNIIQTAIENDGDYRIIVIGGKVVAALWKKRDPNKIVANMSQGNEAIPIKPDKELEELAIKSAKILGIDFSGVDIIEDKITGKRYVLEVNLSPQIFYSTKYSNVSISEEFINFVIHNP